MIVMMLLFAEVIKFGISIVHRNLCRNSSWNLFLTVRKNCICTKYAGEGAGQVL